MGLIAANAALDQDYLQRWAARLGVTAMLEKARTKAQIEEVLIVANRANVRERTRISDSLDELPGEGSPFARQFRRVGCS